MTQTESKLFWSIKFGVNIPINPQRNIWHCDIFPIQCGGQLQFIRESVDMTIDVIGEIVQIDVCW